MLNTLEYRRRVVGEKLGSTSKLDLERISHWKELEPWVINRREELQGKQLSSVPVCASPIGCSVSKLRKQKKVSGAPGFKCAHTPLWQSYKARTGKIMGFAAVAQTTRLAAGFAPPPAPPPARIRPWSSRPARSVSEAVREGGKPPAPRRPQTARERGTQKGMNAVEVSGPKTARFVLLSLWLPS